MTARLFLSCTAPLALALLASVSSCSSEYNPPSYQAGSSNGGGGGAAASSSGGSGAGAASVAGSNNGGMAAAGTSSAAAGAGGGGASSGGTGGGGASSGGTGGGGGGAGGGASAGNGGSGGASGAGGGSAGAGAGFALTTPAWTSDATCSAAQTSGCGVFPKANINTGIGGENKSPQLDWTAGPSGTQSYALVLRDLTNMPGGKPFVHWVLWNIPAATLSLPASLETTAMPAVPAGSSQRSYAGNGYQGSGKCGNVYEFVLYALPTATFTPGGANQTAAADGLADTGAPTATLRARSGSPGCTP